MRLGRPYLLEYDLRFISLAGGRIGHGQSSVRISALDLSFETRY